MIRITLDLSASMVRITQHDEGEGTKKMKKHWGLNRDYWLYWFASSLGMGASNILQYVLSLYVLELTGSATLFASMLSIIIFPRILLTPLAGVMADRVRKSRQSPIQLQVCILIRCRW